jgi:hypothetical protein
MLWIPVFLVLIIWTWPELWIRLVENRLDVEVDVLRRHVKQHERIPLLVKIRNRSWLPCPFVECSLTLPEGLGTMQTSECAQREERDTLRVRTFLLPRQEVVIEIDCFGLQRGPCKITEVSVRVNEGFGLRSLYLHPSVDKTVYVLPNLYELSNQKVPMQDVLGQIEIMRWLFPDETLLRGIREYQRGDAYKHIAWSASARAGKWMTKQFSSATDVRILLVMNAQHSETYWEKAPRIRFDHLCNLTVAIAWQLTAQGFTVEFGSNAVFEGYPKTQWFGVQSAESIQILLGKAHPFANCPLEHILESLYGKALSQHVLILVTDLLTETYTSLLQGLAQRFGHVAVISGSFDLVRPFGISNLTFQTFPVWEIREERDSHVV